MSRTKKIHTCYVILKGKRNKRSVRSWCYKNSEELDILCSDMKIVKLDKDFIIYVRPKHRFKKLKKENINNYRIFRGFLK